MFFYFPHIARDILMVQGYNICHSIQEKNLNKVIFILLQKSQLLKSYIIIAKSHTLCGRIGKVVASYAERCKVDCRHRLHRFIMCTRRSRGTAHEGEVNGQSIGSIISDAIVRRWLWSTATRSCPLDYFSSLTASRL